MKKQIYKILTVLTVMTTSLSTAFAGTWCHIPFHTEDGTQLRLDYEVGKEAVGGMGEMFYVMENPYLHIMNATFNGRENVFLGYAALPQNSVVPNGFIGVPVEGGMIQYYGGDHRFTAKLERPNLPRIARVNNLQNEIYRFQFRVSINGQFLINSDSSNDVFRFRAADFEAFCPNPY